MTMSFHPLNEMFETRRSNLLVWRGAMVRQLSRGCVPVLKRPDLRSRAAAAFTLVELILVMALLAIVIALAAPSLSHFFRGRTLDSEARRFVALARYGQNWAVSEGTPAILWIDQEAGTYGLRDQENYAAKELSIDSSIVRNRSGYEIVDTKRPDFRLAENLRFEIEDTGRTNGRIVTIRLLPDGAIDEGSLRALQILQENPAKRRSSASELESIWIAQSRDRSRYEIVDKSNVWERINAPASLQGGLYVR